MYDTAIRLDLVCLISVLRFTENLQNKIMSKIKLKKKELFKNHSLNYLLIYFDKS